MDNFSATGFTGNLPAPNQSGFPTTGLPSGPPTMAQVLRGRYIYSTGTCTFCHESDIVQPNPDSPRWAAGFVVDPVNNPLNFGSFVPGDGLDAAWNLRTFADNITGDTVTGIGAHTPLELFNGLKTGIHHRGAGNMCVPMPWPIFGNMTDSDVWSLVAYMKILTPAVNLVPWSQDAAGIQLPLSDCTSFNPQTPQPVPAYPAANEVAVTNTAGPGLPNGAPTLQQVLQGRYLVTAQVGCAYCHNHNSDDPNDPKWLSGASDPPDDSRFFSGTTLVQFGPDVLAFSAANITPDVATGIGSWTAQDIFNALRNGVDPQGNFLNPNMPWPMFRNMTDDDLWAIVSYLKFGIKPVSNVAPPPLTFDGFPVPPQEIEPIFGLPGGNVPFPLPPFPTAQEQNPAVTIQN